ncbi:hypothetical protein B0X71_07355 [Planococcus lenghuensis]|uniref:SH3b domain-containing protein n=2 Tax=Planococcus lenghuensis TaxID=2213202 RepID=A0A1Q2L3J4_9BACL|nr:hypothetical protein B0X71_07355 [Planococcus lenghuensis]
MFFSAPVSAAGTVEVTVPSLNVRSGPSLSHGLVGSLSKGNDVNVLSEKGDWYEVKVGSKTGWIASWLTKTVSSETTASATAVSSVNRLNVRSQPSTSGQVLTQMDKGDTATVKSSAGGWTEVDFKGTRGFVSSQYIISKAAAQAQPKPQPAQASASAFTVSVNTLNVRSGADLNSKKIGTVHKGQSFKVLGVQGSWVNIRLADGGSGWVYKSYGSLSGKETAQPKPAVANTGKTVTVLQNRTNVRSNPTTSSAVIGQLNAGTVLNVTDMSNNWYQVKLSNGKTAWIAGWVVSSSDGSKITAPAAQQTASSGSLSGVSIVIDPGHGGIDGGTVGYYKTVEKTLTLQTAELLAANLRAAGASVTLTRSSDHYVYLRDRVAIAHQTDADAFISLHYDSTYDRSVNGFTTYYLHNYQKSLAQHVSDGVDGQTNLRDRGVRTGNYLVLRENRQAAILVELGFLSNPNEERFVSTDQYRRQAAYGIYTGLVDYFN